MAISFCASDGLQFLTNDQIERIVNKYRKKRSTEIAEVLLDEIRRLDDPDQDNVSFCVIKVNDASAAPKRDTAPRPSVAINRPRMMTTMVTDPHLMAIPPLRLDADVAATKPGKTAGARRVAVAK